MKLNKNLPSSLLFSLLCLNSCLFTPASYAADLGVADLAEEMAQTTLVRSVKVQGVFGRVEGSSVVRYPVSISHTQGDDNNVKFEYEITKKDADIGNRNPGFGLTIAGGKYAFEPSQNLHVGLGLNLNLFHSNSALLADATGVKINIPVPFPFLPPFPRRGGIYDLPYGEKGRGGIVDAREPTFIHPPFRGGASTYVEAT